MSQEAAAAAYLPPPEPPAASGFVPTVGWLKDAGAVALFMLAFVLFMRVDVSPPPKWIALALFFAICTDGVFSVIPWWHCAPIGLNAPTIFTCTAGLLVIGLVIAFWYTSSSKMR